MLNAYSYDMGKDFKLEFKYGISKKLGYKYQYMKTRRKKKKKKGEENLKENKKYFWI